MKLFVTGIDIEILSTDDLADFVLNQIESSDPPDLDYCEIALNLSKKWNFLRGLILEICADYNYNEKSDTAYRLLIAIVGERYEKGIISLKEITELFYKIAVQFDPENAEMVLLNDFYELAEMRIDYDFSEIKEKVNYILEENKQEVRKWQ
ncbi:MAG: hypothetical protein IJX24_02180 [Oscillospiraceae bacterium]|nr:hypothetical protein [Oscillospiraceae bacterium]